MQPYNAAWGGFLCCALLSGCSPDNAMFSNGGVGTDLYSSSASASARLEDLYIGLLCDRAGLQTVGAGDSLACASLGPVSNNWTLIVQAGMNDIDRRCDEYLTWLDDRKRSQVPILKQLGDTATATQAIMTIAGTGANAIGIVGVAFGLAANTFTNINSRLLYEVNHSTVQSIVLGNNNRFRQDLMGVNINNRPAAIYALRSYLRLCMPYTIETQINNAVTLFEVGGVASAGANPSPLISGLNVETVQVPMIRNPTAPIRTVKPPIARHEESCLNKIECALTKAQIEGWQKGLCVKTIDGKLGPIDSETRKAIRDYLISKGARAADDASKASFIVGAREKVLLNSIGEPNNCQ